MRWPERRRPIAAALYTALLLAAYAPAAIAAPPWPGGFDARYRVYYYGLPIGAGAIRYRVDADGRYRIRSDVASNALASLLYPYQVNGVSEGRFDGRIPRPLRYRQYQSIGGEVQRMQALFDWPRMRVHARFGQRARPLRLRPRVVDPLSVLLLAISDLTAGFQAERYRLINRLYVSSYRVTNHGSETIDTPIGALAALRVSRQRGDSPRRTTLWFAEARGYVPVQIVYAERGRETVRMSVSALSR